MNGLICFDTRYGSTRSVCESIREGMGIDAEIRNIRDVQHFKYEIIVIGSPVFIGKPMLSVTNFLKDNKEKLKGKNIAIFVTCWAVSTKYADASTEFIEQVMKDLPECNILGFKALPGKLLLDQIEPGDFKVLKRILRRLDQMSEEFDGDGIEWRDARNDEAARQYGKEIVSKYMADKKGGIL